MAQTRAGETGQISEFMIAELRFVDGRLSVGHGLLFPFLLCSTTTHKHHQEQQHDGRVDPELNQEIEPADLDAEGQIVGKFTGRYDVGDRLTTTVLGQNDVAGRGSCLLYTSPSPRDGLLSRMPSSA